MPHRCHRGPQWIRPKRHGQRAAAQAVPAWEKYLEKIYFDPSHPASFKGPTNYTNCSQRRKIQNKYGSNKKMATGSGIVQPHESCQEKNQTNESHCDGFT